jgi:hypothetical protein
MRLPKMRRRLPFFVLALSVLPAAGQAQVLLGAGFTSPTGDFTEVADPGYHVTVGFEVGIPSLPVGLRLDGAYHRMPAPSAEYDAPRIVGGGLDVVFHLPGSGIEPYMLVGIGRYRVSSGPAGSGEVDHDRGFHAGFGVNLGSAAFVEIRWVRISSEGPNVHYVPVSVGLRR